MFQKKVTYLFFVFTITALLTTSLFATDGYFRHGYGIKYSALAGSGVAVSLSSLGAITNPAVIAFVPTQYDVNLAYFSPMRQYTVEGNPSGMQGTFGLMPGTIESDSKSFVFPTLGASWKINPTMAVGVTIYGNGGMNTNYPTQTFYDSNSLNTGVNLEQLFFGATYAIEIAKNQSIGASLIFAYQKFAAQGLASFSPFSSDPSALSGNVNSTSTGFGGKIGYQGQFGKMFRIGASYQTQMYMSKLEKYAGLFAEQGGFNIPASWQAGVAIMPDEALSFMLDVQQILYSQIVSIHNPMLPNLQTSLLGNDDGAGFGWKDMTIFKFGVMYKLPEMWTLYGGYSYGKQPIPESEVLFNILAPAVVESHITLGCSKSINKSNEIILGLMYAPEASLSGANPLDPPSGQTIELKMSQFQIELGYTFSIVQ